MTDLEKQIELLERERETEERRGEDLPYVEALFSAVKALRHVVLSHGGVIPEVQFGLLEVKDPAHGRGR